MAQTVTGWPRSVVADEIDSMRAHLTAHRELMGLKNIVQSYTGNQLCIPIFTRSPEQKAWDAAVQWLKDRAAADAEWPWPKRAEYDRRRDVGYYGEGDPGYGYD